MKALLSLLLFLPIAAFAGNGSGNVSNVAGIGASKDNTAVSYMNIYAQSDSVSPVFTLYMANHGTITAGRFFALYKDGVQYQVTAGKRCYCFNVSGGAGTTGSSFQFVSDTSPIVANSSALTAGVYQTGSAGSYPMLTNYVQTIATPIPGTYSFAASTYPGVQVSAAVNYYLVISCYEK